MKTKGISLIVLVITIILLAILASTIILSIIKSEIINTSNDAVKSNDIANIEELIATTWMDAETDYHANHTDVTKSEYFTQANLNKYFAKSGKIIGLLYTSDTATFMYISNSNNKAYDIKITNDSGTSVVGGPYEVGQEGKLTELITTDNYGDRIKYNGNGITDWRVFYEDDENVFIITADYLPSMYIPEGLGMERAEGQYRTSFKSFPITSIDLSVAKKYMLSAMYDTTTPLSTNTSGFKATATLLYTPGWSAYVDSDFADSAVGAPTLEMWIGSWNDKYNDTLIYSHTSIGYMVAESESSTLVYKLDKAVMQPKPGYLVDAASNMYYPRKEDFSDNGGNCVAYRLASPSAYGSGTSQGIYLMRINADGRVYYDATYTSRYAARPVVCMNKNTEAVKIGNSWYLI